jgi:hypothetical protein
MFSWNKPRVVEIHYCGKIFYAIEKGLFIKKYLGLEYASAWCTLDVVTVSYVATLDIKILSEALKKYNEKWAEMVIKPLDKTGLERIVHDLE